MLVSNDDLFRSVKDLNLVSEQKLRAAYQKAKSKNLSLAEVLVDEDLVSDDNIGQIISDHLSVAFVKLSQQAIEKQILNIIPELVAKKQQIIAFAKDKKGLHLAMANPTDKQMIEFVGIKSGLPVVPHYATQREIQNALALYKKDIGSAFDDVKSQKDQTSVIKILDTIISYAYDNRASDIHIEPFDNSTLIRFRIDGILHDVISIPSSLHEQLVTRVKVMAKLRTDEHQAAQDGKISQKLEAEDVDIRVSIVPITNGEKVVLRILSEKSRQFSLKDLGFSEEELEKVANAYNKPHGLILATGPTGSGKTTTLYAILKLLNEREVNIMTIEDPVEYDIQGINQIQVNPKTDLTFAKGLRSIVRQDPDIVLVGEIRDEETAEIAVNAAMTGHLVLSTLHTNDAATAIPRLMDMKVEPFLVGSTVNVIIAQRLVRKICTKCRVSKEPDSQILKFTSTSRIYYGKGCRVCHDTGYQGRVGIYEVLIMSDEIRKAISERRDANYIQDLAVKEGMRTMFQDGLEKVRSGITTIDEVLRVTKE